MAVVNGLSTQLTNTYALPPVLSSPHIAAGIDTSLVDVCAVAATDSAGSIYRYFRIPSNARIEDIQVMNDALTSGSSYKIGVYKVGDPGSSGGAVVLANSDLIFGSAISFVTARSIWTSVYFPSILNAGGAAANTKLRIWELLGFTSDPVQTYDIGIAAVTASSVAGNIAMQLTYVE